MDMIYTNAQHEEQGVLLEYEMDLAIGADENDFELTLAAESHCCEGGSLVYMEGTEYGGIVDALRSKTDTAEVIYTGRTWHGMLNGKVIEPDAGEDYYVVSGDANVILSTLIDRLGLSGLFSVSGAASGIAVANYHFHRYCGGYDGIRAMLSSHGAKLKIEWKDRAVHLSAVPITDNSSCELMPEDAVLDVSKTFRTVSHLICLGQGELSERTVIHLYADTAGNIGTEQVITGLDEITDVYENTTAASSEELEELGRAKFKELLKAVNIDASLDTENDTYDIGDIVGAVDEVTGASFAAEVTKKVVTVKNGVINTDLTTGAAKKAAPSEGGGSSAQTDADTLEGKSISDIMQAIYPVGAIYTSTVETSPATLFGFGTWERIQDTFLLAAGSTYAAGATGGEAKHTLTVYEMPTHTHNYHTTYGTAAAESTTNGKFQAGGTNNAWIWAQSGSIVETGGSGAHNNMPPYLAVYIWKRTA